MAVGPLVLCSFMRFEISLLCSRRRRRLLVRGETDVLGEEFGVCNERDAVCFQRLPDVTESRLVLLAIDAWQNDTVRLYSSPGSCVGEVSEGN